MINSFSQTIIQGQSEYIPVISSPHNCVDNHREGIICTNGYQHQSPVVEYKSAFGSMQIQISDAHRVSAKLNDRYTTICHSRRIFGTLNHIPKALKFIYERDEKNWTERELNDCTWHPRIKMFWKAYQCNEIYALSIVPKNSSTLQTWYTKKLLTHDPLYVDGGTGHGIAYGYESKDSNSVVNSQPEHFNAGFIKPFQNYTSDDNRFTIDLDNLATGLQIEMLSNPDDVQAIVQQDYPEPTQDVVNSVLNSFLEDSEATHIGLLTINPHQQKIYTKA